MNRYIRKIRLLHGIPCHLNIIEHKFKICGPFLIIGARFPFLYIRITAQRDEIRLLALLFVFPQYSKYQLRTSFEP